MCDPATAMFVGGQMLGLATEQRNASAQRRYNQQQSDLNSKAANESALGEYLALHRRQVEEHQAEVQAINRNADAAAAAMGTARAAAGEGGVSGNSAAALIDEYRVQELNALSDAKRNRKMRDAQVHDQKQAIWRNQKANLINAMPALVPKPDFLGALLRMGSGGLSMHQEWTKNNPSPYGPPVK